MKLIHYTDGIYGVKCLYLDDVFTFAEPFETIIEERKEMGYPFINDYTGKYFYISEWYWYKTVLNNSITWCNEKDEYE